MFIAVRRLFALTALLALAVSCQGPSGDPDPIGELPPISDWPHSGSGAGTLDPGANPSQPGTMSPSGTGSTGGSVSVTPGGGAGGVTTGGLDAGSVVATRDAGPTNTDSSPITGDAGVADGGSFDVDGGSSDGGDVVDGGDADGGCPIQIAPDAGRCFGRGCFLPFDAWRPIAPGGCNRPRQP